MKRWIRKAAQAAGYTLVNTRRHYGEDGLYTLHDGRFQKDSQFRDAYLRGVQANAGIDPHFEWRVHIALWVARQALSVAGDFVECGVNTGLQSSAIMRRLDWAGVARTFYLVDTFRGPVLEQFSAEEKGRGRDALAQKAISLGAYATDLNRVLTNFSEWPNARVVAGVIPEILEQVPVERVAFLHIDLNCAYPERTALEYFWPRLSPGAHVLLDDYAYFGHGCQAEAIEGTVRTLGVEILVLPTGQGLIVKP